MQQILTRGYLFGAISWKFGAIAAIIVTSIFFAALHAAAFIAGPLAAINLLTAGLIFGFARAVTHSLWFAAGLHFLWNFTGSVVLGFLPAHYDFTLSLAELSGDALWMGGSFGFETGLAVAIANGVLLTGLIAWFALRTSRTKP